MNPTGLSFYANRNGPSEPNAREGEHFVEAMIARGEAVEAPDNELLAPGALHKIIGRTEDGLPIVQRRGAH